MASTVTDVIDGVTTSTAIKAPVKYATTANITLSGAQTIDGATPADNDRILVKDQTTATQNGIYKYSSTGAWARTADFDGNRDVKTGTLVFVQSGTTNSETMWRVTTADPIVIGTSSIGFESALINDSSVISFLQSGTGAVSRSVQSKLRDTVSVTDFGATGDGTTNDSTAFTNAEAEDKLVFIPRTASGYNLTSTVSTTTAAWLIDPTLTWAQFSDSGQLDIRRGFYTGQGNGANIWRFADRVFVGEAASENAGIFSAGGGGDSWFCHEFVAYTSGGTYEIVAGDTITGATSGATAKVVSLTLTSGTWAGGDAAGVLTVNFRTGTFQAENLNVGANTNVATIAGATAASYPSYLARSAQLLSSTTSPGVSLGGITGVVGVGRTSDADNGVLIGVGSAVVNDKASGDAWGFIAEIQKESGADFTTGLEVAAKNKGSNTSMNPYARTGGVFGVWLAAGGDNTFGGSSANPSDTAIAIVKNSNTWNRGIVFEDDSITGTDGITGTGIAIQMAKGHIIEWLGPSGISGARIRSDVATASSNVSQIFIDNGFQLTNTGGIRFFQARSASSGVNFIDALSAATGSGPVLSAQGSDTNVDLNLDSKGTGNLILDPKSGDVKIEKALVALGGGAAPTLGTIGGSGPATAGQNSWLRLLDSSGAAMWVPVWK